MELRLHLFEFEDLSQYPDVIRRGQTDFLRQLMQVFDVFGTLIPLISESIQKSEHPHIYDFCSGGGATLLQLKERLEQQVGQPIRVTLSDLYPNVPAFEYAVEKYGKAVDFIATPVDVREIPTEYQGYYTLFNAFHHLRPEEAQQVLKQAVARRLPIGIFEPIDKSVIQLFINTVGIGFLMLLFTPFIKPFRWDRLLLTYLVPLIPICTMWDGFVSALRLYSPKRLRQMVADLEVANYHWEIGKVNHRFGKGIYLIGYPL